ncbi:MAG TPA: FUSC family protein [Humibacter sp.]|nr:FUSC family protein [Humibacter sp.]
MPRLQTVLSARRSPVLQVTKSAIATVAAWLIASLLLPAQLPVFGAVAALLVVQPSVNQSLGKAVERSIGVIVGVLVAYGAGLVFGSSRWIVLLAIVLAIFVSWALKLTPGTSNQVPISAMLVLSVGASTPNYALDRIVETIIGAGIGVVVNLLIVPPVLLGPAHDSIIRLVGELGATFNRLATALSDSYSPTQLEELLITARLLRPMQQKATTAMTDAEESLALNPRRSRHSDVLKRDAALLGVVSPLVNRAIFMTRSVRDHYDGTVADEPLVPAIADELRRAAHDLRRLTHTSGRADEHPEPPALTAPLVVSTPQSRHWVLLGSLLEDLRRVHEQLTGDAA